MKILLWAACIIGIYELTWVGKSSLAWIMVIAFGMLAVIFYELSYGKNKE